FSSQKGDKTRDNAEAQKLYAHANDLKVRASGLDAKIEQFDMRARSLVREQKKVGPSLKEARMKLRKEWIPVWLKDPHAWREGKKANYDYLVRWIHNPRQRTAPYCPFEKKDLTAADYERHNLPYVFDLEHTKCPNDGHELQVQQMTPMPSLRLTEDEARDIASYLMTRKHDNASYNNADYMEDPNLKNQGLSLVRNYGCAGCHEIAGLEEEQRIGTELTK